MARFGYTVIYESGGFVYVYTSDQEVIDLAVRRTKELVGSSKISSQLPQKDFSITKVYDVSFNGFGGKHHEVVIQLARDLLMDGWEPYDTDGYIFPPNKLKKKYD